MRDHLGPHTLYGADALLFFRLSRPRIELIIQTPPGDPFFGSCRTDRCGKEGLSIKAKVLLAIGTLAYGLASYCISDYFSMSKFAALECFCRRFNKDMLNPVIDGAPHAGGGKIQNLGGYLILPLPFKF
jgi:hypothetical protein